VATGDGPRPLDGWPRSARAGIRCVFTDIDDTLTLDGRLPAVAYAAMERLARAGIAVVPVTGRPAGWCDHIARMWPVEGVVGENGAFWFRYDPDRRRLVRRFLESEEVRRRNRRRLEELGRRILAEVPGCALASDQHYRESDLAIDWCEDVPPLDEAAVARILALFREAGCTAKVSSIHVNGWFGDYDKLAMTRLFAREALGFELDAERSRCCFVGDSPNDEPMFRFFSPSVGVANLARFADRMRDLPDFLTARPGGEGFAELAEALLAARA